MSRVHEIHVQPHHNEAVIGPCQHVWSAVGQFLRWVGHHRLPGLVQAAVSVAEPLGRVSMQSEPYTIPMGECDVYTVLSANLWHDWPRFKDLERRLAAFASLAESVSADLILLQELARTSSFQSDAWLGQRLGMAYVYSRANGSQKIGFEEGLGVFSRFPLKQLPYVRHMGKSCNPFSRRLTLGARVDTPCGELMAFSTHLALARRQNAAQVRELHLWIDHLTAGRSAIVAGDFNAPEHTHQIQRIRSFWQDTFREIHEHGHAATHELRWPWGAVFLRHRLDYIFLQPGEPAWQILDVQHVDAPGGPHSDHRAVLARLAPVLA